MSSPQPSSAAEDQQAGQAALASSAAGSLAAAWLLLDVTRMAATLPAFIAAVRAVAVKFGQAAAAAALQHYKTQRHAAGIPGRVSPSMPPQVPQEAVDAIVRWATKDLWQPNPDIDAAQAALAGAVDKLVMDQGRTAIIQATTRDRDAKGWARVPHPDETLTGTCAFCLMLATRGAVYKSKASAKFEAHDSCHCTAEPQFSDHYEPTATVRAAQALYAESTKGVRGSKAKRLAFRRAVDARRTSGEPAAPAVPEPVKVPADAARALIGRLEKSLTTMRGNNRDGSLDKTIHATEQRINALRDQLPVAV